ncbi:uncharacterized protein BDR25DRAFT_278981 [Lindgomyces ingoldianus]|uniref:Uncharacterized protein n=1 Tax=Lindgomyces ingoldianus TaxID=673940 RepID=A0ACB6R6Y7_9PLEO|nr:uncharacterized protein BDR25DRAFT_278981 [Lindgomyces ingoldianus]KAF2475069.1 hypothetical protein BDR25DRAFT_278981 [Lindgomyces ingoldianus]
MSPRKKSKPNPKAAVDTTPGLRSSAATGASNTASDIPSPSEIPQNAPSNKSVAESGITSDGTSTHESSSLQTLNKKPSRKWLGGTGSWRSKAPAIAKIAKESIGVSRGATAELPGEHAKSPKEQEQSPKKFLSKRKSSKGDAIPAAMTKLTVSSDGSVGDPQGVQSGATPMDPADPPPPTIEEPPFPPDPQKKEPNSQATSTFGWRSWWSRPDGYDSAQVKEGNAQNDTDEAQRTPLPGATPSEDADTKSKELGNSTAPDQSSEQTMDVQAASEMVKDASAGTGNVSSTSWFWLWSSGQNAQTNPSPTASQAGDSSPGPVSTALVAPVESPKQPEMLVEAPLVAHKETLEDPPKPSGWAFWIRQNPKVESNTAASLPHKQVGEVAVFDTPSQSNPEAAQFNEQEEQANDQTSQKNPLKQLVPEAAPAPKKSFMSLRGRTKAKSSPTDTPIETPSSSMATTPSNASPSHSSAHTETAPAAQLAPNHPAKTKEQPNNIILPEFNHTYRLVQRPSYWQQIRQYFLGGESAQPHLHINPAPPRIRKAVAIGVHGFFPAAMFQKILGQPKGTSVRFANAAAAAIEEWTQARGYSAEIEKVALEGEGFIADRVKTLWTLLVNWMEHIKAADFVLVACHSQGVPVAIMLVAKLIQFGCVGTARIGICAMAGVNMGPFIEYKTRYLGPTAAELFSFSDPKSLVSEMYLGALDEVLRNGVRILYIGSIDDQLVSLESSTFSTLSHPYIYRAVFVDGRIHAPDFLTHLVGFALKLRNLGLPDHGLVRELSPALAGSLYVGEGHSRVYEDPRVYSLAVSHALETTSLPIQTAAPRPSTAVSLAGINIPVPGAKENKKDPYALRVKDYENGGGSSANQNPYFLPWAMRGLLEEEFVKKELGREVEGLLGMFEEWKPVKKELRDVKFRLEGVRSKL